MNFKVDKNQLASFFGDVLKTELSDFELSNKIMNDSNEKQKVNIMFITTDCNFNCDYCYQKADREKNKSEVMNEKDVDKFLADVCLREPYGQSTIVIFGGEPFLNPKIFYYVLDKTNEITKNTGKKFGISTVTNGYYFRDTKNIQILKEYMDKSLNEFLLEVSYDVSGQDRRILRNGESSKPIISNVLKTLKELKIPLGIRYTVHKVNQENVVKDLIKLQEFYKNTNLLKRITLSWNFQEIFVTENDLKEYGLAMWDKYKIPICKLNCALCRQCNFDDFEGIKYQMKDTDFIVDGNQGEFKHFSINTKNKNYINN